jgi:hypothetical protein
MKGSIRNGLEGSMVDTVFPYQVVLFTQHYSITGGLFLREQRLSDFLNDRRDTSILMRNTSVARLENPAKILEKAVSSIVPKSGIILAFEPPQKTGPIGRQFIKYPKLKYDVFVALDGIEVRGQLNQAGPIDLRGAMTNASESFLPITQATVVLKASPNFIVKREAVLVNVQRIRFLGELEQKETQEDVT